MQSASKFTVDLSEAVAGMQSVLELRQPDLALLEGVDGKPGSFGRAAASENVVAHCNELLLCWSATAEEALNQGRQPAAEASFRCVCFAATPVQPDGSEVWVLPVRRHGMLVMLSRTRLHLATAWGLEQERQRRPCRVMLCMALHPSSR